MSTSSSPDEPENLLPPSEGALILLEAAAPILASSSSKQVVFLKRDTAMPASSGSSESGEIAETESEDQDPHQVLEYGTVHPADLLRSIYDSLRTWYEVYVADVKPGESKSIPSNDMLLFPKLFEKSWGYDRLYPNVLDEWGSYREYLEKFYKLNCVPPDDLNAYVLCLEKENELRTEWLIKKISVPHNEIDLSNHITRCALKLLVSRSAQDVTAMNAAKCIAKEAELIIERLRCSPNVLVPEEPPNQSTKIRQLALSYMSEEEQGCPYVRLMINVGMVGITKEAELMCVNLRHGCLNSYEIYLNREIRCFAVELTAKKFSGLIDSVDVAPIWKALGENKFEVSPYIETEAQKHPGRYVDDTDSGESDRSSKKASGFENSEKKQTLKGTIP